MRLQDRKSEGVDVNMTPLIDVVFLLLIFFVLTTTFQKEARLRVELPSTSAADRSMPRHPIEITVDATGKILMQGAEDGEWKNRLSAVATDGGERSLIIRADQQAPHGSVMKVMDVAQQLGILNLSIASENNR